MGLSINLIRKRQNWFRLPINQLLPQTFRIEITQASIECPFLEFLTVFQDGDFLPKVASHHHCREF